MDVVIPDTIMDYPVTAIAEKAFSLESTIRSISIGKNVRSIGEMPLQDARLWKE